MSIVYNADPVPVNSHGAAISAARISKLHVSEVRPSVRERKDGETSRSTAGVAAGCSPTPHPTVWSAGTRRLWTGITPTPRDRTQAPKAVRAKIPHSIGSPGFYVPASAHAAPLNACSAEFQTYYATYTQQDIDHP